MPENSSETDVDITFEIEQGTGSLHAITAQRLATARTIAIAGSAQGSTLFDGSKDVTISTKVNIETMTNLELEELLK